MRKFYFVFLGCMILLSPGCDMSSDKENGVMDSIGNPMPNPKHTDTLRSINDSVPKTDTLYR